MNVESDVKAAASVPHLIKADPASPVLKITESGGIAIKAGTTFGDHVFDQDTPLAFADGHPKAGADYVVVDDFGKIVLEECLAPPVKGLVLGGFHFAPGGNAVARVGGDDVPAINAHSIWDANFRPACADPRGMALIDGAHGHRFWCDIYLLGVDHLNKGSSKFSEIIADGSNCPKDPATGKKLKRFEYQNALDAMAHHGKQLLSFDEFAHAAYGVTEKSSAEEDPEITKLDAPRTSKFGIMQATGNMWVWGHDGDPDAPRASFFGGPWWSEDNAGSRYAFLGSWAVRSYGSIGARGRSDHLQLG